MAWVRRNMNKNKGIASDEYPRQTLDLNEPHDPQRVAENDDLYAHLTEQFQVNVLDVWKKTLDQEVEKRKVAEAILVKREEDLRRSQKMCMVYSIENAKLEAINDMRDASSCVGAGAGGDGNGEEVQSSGHPNLPLHADTVCGTCWRRIANVIWVPCRHLSVCSNCEETATNCPVCCCKKFGNNLKINWP